MPRGGYDVWVVCGVEPRFFQRRAEAEAYAFAHGLDPKRTIDNIQVQETRFEQLFGSPEWRIK